MFFNGCFGRLGGCNTRCIPNWDPCINLCPPPPPFPPCFPPCPSEPTEPTGETGPMGPTGETGPMGSGQRIMTSATLQICLKYNYRQTTLHCREK